MARGRLRRHGSPETLLTELVESTGVVVIEVTPGVAAIFPQIPEGLGRDPVDRIIVATARAEGLTRGHARAARRRPMGAAARRVRGADPVRPVAGPVAYGSRSATRRRARGSASGETVARGLRTRTLRYFQQRAGVFTGRR